MVTSSPLTRRRRARPSGAILALLPVVGAVAFACTFNTAAWYGRLYPGFFLWQNNFVPAIGTMRDAAVKAGLRYQSRLIAVDGEPVRDRAEVEAHIGSRPPGTVFHYTFEKDGERYGIDLRSTRLTGAFVLTLGNYLWNALALLALGVVIIFLEPESRAARAFFFFCMNYGLYLATSIDLVGPSWFQSVYFLLVTLCPATALQTAIDFPAVPPHLAGLRRWLPWAYAFCLALGIATLIAFSRSFPLLLQLDRVTHLAIGAAGLGAVTIVVLALRRPPSAAARERLRIMLLGIAGAFLIPVLVLLAVYTAGAPIPLNYLTLGFAIFPAAMAYAIARHDLFGVDRMIRRTVAYVVVTCVIGVVYSGLLAYLDYVVMPDLSASPAVHILITMLLVVLFNPLRGRVQALVDLLYFRAPYEYRTTVAAASEALAAILDLDDVVARLVGIITEQMQVGQAEVWLHDAATDSFRREGVPSRAIPADGALPRYLAEHAAALHVGQGLMGGRVPAEALAGLEAIGAVLAVPMVFEQGLAGFLALGEKRSGRFYTTDDIELLTTLGHQSAVAVQNARAYRALAEANRELREARDQLVEAERLAAIGELSAAVAHGIRNPVAGIKTAAELAVLEARPDDPLRESFMDILSEADALESRISELLDFARPFVPNFGPGDLNELVRGSLHVLRRQIAAQHVTVSTGLAPELPPHALDAAQIEQVCLALLTNAIEAMPGGGALTVTTAAADGMVEMRIRDTGHGIAADQLPRIFRLFYTRKARGTGVGLAIVKRIVEGHHGRIGVTSAPGAGTEFHVTMPCDPATTRLPASAAASEARDGVDGPLPRLATRG